MILKFSFEYSSSSFIYEKIILRTLKIFNLKSNLSREKEELVLHVSSDNTDDLENFANKLSLELPYSIFLHNTEVIAATDMPNSTFLLPQTSKISMPFCPKCLEEVRDEANENYYNPFHQCEVCGYDVYAEKDNYKEKIQIAAQSIQDGLILEVDTLYGKYCLGKLSAKCNDFEFDIVSFDLHSIENYTHAAKTEMVALGAIEKPFIELKTNVKFKMDFEDIQKEFIRFKLADDFILYFLLLELNILGENLVFISKECPLADTKLSLHDSANELEPIECVVSDSYVAILKGQRGLAKFHFEGGSKAVIPHIGAFHSVIKEHDLFERTVIGVNISREYHNDILVYAKKFGTIEYLSFEFAFDSMAEVFEAIRTTSETAARLMANYEKRYKEHHEVISKIVFEVKEFNIYALWGVVSIVLGFSKDANLRNAAKIFESNANSFLGTKGPRIDYKLKSIDSKVYLDPLMTIRTAMSFRLAEVDSLTLSYGVIESFVEFIANQLDEIKSEMKADAVVVTGSLLGNRHLFSKLCKEVSINHNLYFNKELPVDGRNILYGGNELY
ncbi:MAG: hydrogenase [Helicobacteraceae bacterium]|nr:hydrogenase [Candidatus Sulfurimonas ponti]MBL6973739.1 hydrogenase [Sulfurimonas sp.]